ncbi:MAG: D-2-hydroxyacid dehydrogenase [Pedobacter sp.]|nr:D-2-hydroxyacid dehydrogenase [Pedobacter sp.]MDQ8052196.1 D-2-hydroxyacid dehydrogenase [Pedobacter sp.]
MKVIIDLPVYEPILQAIKALPDITIKIVDQPEEKVRPLPVDWIADADALLCTFPPENHSEMKNLRYLQIASAGFTQLVDKGFAARGITCCNALGVFDVPIAEWNMAMMVNLARDARQLHRNQDAEVWDRSARFQREIRGSVVGIWGYGGIGRETARLAKAMGMKVHVMTRNGIASRDHNYCVAGTGDPKGTLPDRIFISDEKEDFLKDLDFLILAMPQTAENEGIIGGKELGLLKKTAFILNPARGPLIQENALIQTLQQNQIAGAALDTHYHYPMPHGHPLWQLQNVIFTPHISGSSASPMFLARVWDIFYQNLIRLQKNQPLLNVLSGAALVS